MKNIPILSGIFSLVCSFLNIPHHCVSYTDQCLSYNISVITLCDINLDFASSFSLDLFISYPDFELIVWTCLLVVSLIILTFLVLLHVLGCLLC